MTLLSSKRFTFDLKRKTRSREGRSSYLVPFPALNSSKYGRYALSVDIIPPSTPITTCRLVNVHLDSLGDTLPYRIEQMVILANLPREPNCGSGLIARDFNAISPEDHTLFDKNGLVDAWVALHGKEELDGATWGVEVERNDGLGPGRLDGEGYGYSTPWSDWGAQAWWGFRLYSLQLGAETVTLPSEWYHRVCLDFGFLARLG